MSRRVALRWLLPLVLMTVTLGGCTPLPFISPPMRATFNPGVLDGNPQLDNGQGRLAKAAPYLGGRFGVHPLGLVPSMAERPADFAVGYALEGTVVDSMGTLLSHGPYVEGAYHIWQTHWKDGRMARLAVFGAGELLLRPGSDEVGGGASGGIGIEYGKWLSDPFVSEGVNTKTDKRTGKKRNRPTTTIGVAVGEASVGAELRAGYRRLGDDRWWMVTFGLTFRLPASAGVHIIWL